MMSTATPLKDANGNYYPILQQGAGLADTAAATSADSYITVDGMPDGKVKAELGDDPNRTGEYSFSFNIHNISNEGKVYALSASLFTQDAFRSYANANMSQDLSLIHISEPTRQAEISYAVFCLKKKKKKTKKEKKKEKQVYKQTIKKTEEKEKHKQLERKLNYKE